MPGEEQVEFLNKLGEIPVLNDSWFAAADYYSKVKDYNALMRMTLSMAESGVKVAGQLSTPVLNRCQPQINNLNEFACKTLDNLETKYPAIKQPTEQWKESCTDFVEPVVGRVKPVISQVQGIVDNGKQRISNIKTASTNMVEGAKNRGVDTVSHVVNTTFETAPGRFVTRTVDSALDMADNLVDRYLPEEKEEKEEMMETEEEKDEDKQDDEDDEETTKTDLELEKMEVMDPTPKRVLVHATTLTDKIRKRMYRRAVKDITYARARASAALKKMTNTVEMMDLAKNNMNSAKDKVDSMWKDIVNESDSNEKSVSVGSVEDRIIALGRIMARQVRSGVTALEKAYSELGEFSKHPISKSQEYKDLIATFLSADSLKNMTSQQIQKAKESLKYLQDRVRNVIPSVSWVAVDINMDNIPITETDLGMEQVMSTNNNSEDELEREENR